VVRPVEPTKSRANGILAGRKTASDCRSHVHSAAPGDQGETRVASGCPEWPQAVSSVLMLAATFCQPFRFSPMLVAVPIGRTARSTPRAQQRREGVAIDRHRNVNRKLDARSRDVKETRFVSIFSPAVR
jgi:hypothetical protein